MKVSTALLQSRSLNLAVGLALASLWATFSYAHILGFRNSGDWAYLLFCFSETLMAILFLIRSEPVTVSTDPVDWALAIGATFAPLVFMPASWGILPAARLAMVAGITIQIAGLISLNRSFGIVAARREIKTGGMYRIVRHPLYAAYLFSCTGYLLVNTSAMNLAVYVTAMSLLLFRLLREERHLAMDSKYREYMNRVRYRVIPAIF